MIDARGLSCPQPVVMVQKAIKADPSGAAIQVDDPCAVENITRFGNNQGYQVDVQKEDGYFTLTLKK